MDKYIINGGISLDGKVKVESAKNAVLPLLAAAILTDEQVIIEDCPKIKDVLNMIKILNDLGCKTKFEEDNLIVDSASLCGYSIPALLTKELRSSIFMLGSIISRVGKAKLAYPGGCEIGIRPIDLHLSGLKQLGVTVKEKGGELICSSDRIRGSEIYLDFPSVGATENLMLASAISDGITLIHNAAKEPEIVDLMNFLNSMGAKILGGGTGTVRIDGVKKLHGTTYKPLPDRIEAGTYLIAAAISGGSIELSNCRAENFLSLIHKLIDNTCKITINNDIIYLKSGVVKKPFRIETNPYPGFPTDLQAQATALATVCNGISLITENIFEMRFKHIGELKKMGADVCISGRTAIINGVRNLRGAEVYAHDLRGGAALILAALAAEGETTVNNIFHVERGYLNIEKKLTSLGAIVTRK